MKVAEIIIPVCHRGRGWQASPGSAQTGQVVKAKGRCLSRDTGQSAWFASYFFGAAFLAAGFLADVTAFFGFSAIAGSSWWW